MEHLDRLVPLIILGVVGAVLLILVRRTGRAKEVVRRQEQPLEPVIVAPVVRPIEVVEPPGVPVRIVDESKGAATPVTPGPVLTQSEEPSNPYGVAQRPKRLRAKPPAAAAPETTSISRVLGLLKEKDSLAAAFLLREIFDAPVSRRRRARCQR